MGTSIQQKFNEYRLKNPILNIDAIADLMYENKEISAYVRDEIKKGTSLFLLDNKNTDYKFKTLDNYVEDKLQTIKPSSRTKHKIYQDLEITSNGDIDMEQFTEERLMQKYPSDKYNFVHNDNVLFIIDKSTDICIAQIEEVNNIVQYTVSEKNELDTVYAINKSGKLGCVSKFNGSMSEITCFDSSGSINWVYINDEDNNIKQEIRYKNGLPVQIFDYKPEYNDRDIILETLVDNLSKPDFQLNKDAKEMVIKYIKNGIDEINVVQIMSDFKSKYNKDLIEVINQNFGFDYVNKEEIIQKLEKSIELSPYGGEYIAKNIINAFKSGNSAFAMKYIKMINKNNLSSVLENFSLLKKENFYRGIISTITDSSVLTNKQKEFCIDYLRNIALEMQEIVNNISDGTGFKQDLKDIQKDIKSHLPGNYYELEVDLLRLSHRYATFYDNNSNVNNQNGKLDRSCRQNNIGDCWLISVINSVCRTPAGKKYLESLLEYNPKTGDVTVNLKGVNKKYLIKSSEIAERNQLVDSDGDIRAIEIAVDRYIKEAAYDNTSPYGVMLKRVDIEGYDPHYAFKLLLGDNDNSLKVVFDFSNYDLNNPQYAFCIGNIEDAESINAYYTKTGSRATLISQHAYSVYKMDEENIYLLDPNNKIEYKDIERTLITVPRKCFKDNKFQLFTAKIP